MREKRTSTGSSFAWGSRLALLALLAGLGQAKKPQAPYALVAGTVFREDGRSLPGAEVELAPAPSPQSPHKSKKMKAVSDARGEFAFRVPTADLDYSLTAKAPGYQPREKTVKVSGEVRVDVFFRLEAASKPLSASDRKEAK
jgi:Carboxypeptidase regulatory-like domain